MRQAARVLGALLLGLLVPIAVFASVHEDAAAIRQTCERWCSAYEKKDETGVLVPVMAKGYVGWKAYETLCLDYTTKEFER